MSSLLLIVGTALPPLLFRRALSSTPLAVGVPHAVGVPFAPRMSITPPPQLTAPPSAKKRAVVSPRPLATASPHQWWKQLKAIERQRSARNAAVDFLGCHTLGHVTDGAANHRFQTLTALVLSPRTSDVCVAHAMQRLRLLASVSQEEEVLIARNRLTAAAVASLDVDLLTIALRDVRYSKTKAGRLSQLARTLVDEHGGDVPREMRELLALPGVGPKVAHLYSQVGLGETRGIAVDTHVHRIAARLGWTRGARDAEASRKQLEAWLPPDRWQELSPLMVGFGQRVCADRPACRTCHLAAERLCPQIGLALDGGSDVTVNQRTLQGGI